MRLLLLCALLPVVLTSCKQRRELASDVKLNGGGEDTDDLYPSTLLLVDGGAFGSTCTGAKVGKRFILTAAHCLMQWRDIPQQIPTFYVRNPSYARGSVRAFTNKAKPTQVPDFLPYHVERIHTFPGFFENCEAGCNWVFEKPFLPDVALIETQEDLPETIPTAVISPKKLRIGQKVDLVGYGCEAGHGSQEQQTFFDHRRKFLQKKALKPETFNKWVKEAPFRAYAFTPTYGFGMKELPTPDANGERASLCPGDSGGPMYDGESARGTVIVGVNSSGFWRREETIAEFNYHTRVDAEGPFHVYGWLGRILGYPDAATIPEPQPVDWTTPPAAVPARISNEQ